MSLNRERIEKLTRIARMYYEQNMNQSQIAVELAISRPLVSRYLAEARDYGIVRIEIRSPQGESELLMERLQQRFGLRGGAAVEDEKNIAETNRAVAACVLSGLPKLEGMTVGVGWGSIMGCIADKLDESQSLVLHTRICPLVADSNVSNRNYHTSRIAEIFAEKTGGEALHWEAPAFVDSLEEMKRLKETEEYKRIVNGWRTVKVAFVNIGNYPSVPDFATAASYGNRLSEQKAVGRLLSQYYDINGRIIKPDIDCTMQIPIEILSKRRYVVGVCAANVSPRALAGALKTGIFTHIIAAKGIIADVLRLAE